MANLEKKDYFSDHRHAGDTAFRINEVSEKWDIKAMGFRNNEITGISEQRDFI